MPGCHYLEWSPGFFNNSFYLYVQLLVTRLVKQGDFSK
jgi:hypothetical protein